MILVQAHSNGTVCYLICWITFINPSDDFESEEEEEVEIAVITPPVETADCGSQYEDLKVQEENILTWKKKLRVKRRKVVSTQPLTPYGDGKRLEYSLALPQITPGGSNLLQQR